MFAEKLEIVLHGLDHVCERIQVCFKKSLSLLVLLFDEMTKRLVYLLRGVFQSSNVGDYLKRCQTTQHDDQRHRHQ